MKKAVYIFLFFTCAMRGQNLVPNPSFEDHYNCTNSSYTIDDAVSWTGMETPDYFNICIPPSSVFQTHVPRNFFGYQLPFKGNAYAGLFVFNGYNYREYIQTALSQKLDSGIFYCVNFHVNLADTSLWAIKEIGAYFSSDTLAPHPYQSIATPPWSIFTNYIPQIESNTLMNDTVLWNSINGIFLAAGNEQYITIGNFRDDLSTDTVRFRNSGVSEAYYYIDDVSVEAVYPANAGPDWFFFTTDSVQLGNNPTENATYSWSPAAGLSDANAPNPKASPAATTTYILTKTQCSVTTHDTVTVHLTGVSVNEHDAVNGYKVYPNPSNGNFTIEHSSTGIETAMLNIYDLTGTLILSTELNFNGKKTLEINAEGLQPGVYQYEFLSNKKTSTRGRLLIKK